MVVAGLLLTQSVSAKVLREAYIVDSTNHTVTYGNQQWLQFSVTAGMSINDALAVYGSDGWGVATESEVADLFDVFFPWVNWSITEDEAHGQSKAISVDEYTGFKWRFGSTYPAYGGITEFIYGSDSDSDGYYMYGWVGRTDYQHYASLGGDSSYMTADKSNFELSVALVRYLPDPTSVPEPGALLLMGLGFVAAGACRRKGR